MKDLVFLLIYMIIIIGVLGGLAILRGEYKQSIDQNLKEKIADYKNRIDVNRNNCR